MLTIYNFAAQYEKRTEAEVDDQNVSYDYLSVMHYGPTFFLLFFSQKKIY